MQAIYRSGERTSVSYTAPETDVESGDVVVVGTTLVGVATTGIAADELGAIDISGVFEVCKITENVIAAGDPIYWDATGNPAVGDAETGAASDSAEAGVFMGHAVEAASEDAATVYVYLEQLPVAPS